MGFLIKIHLAAVETHYVLPLCSAFCSEGELFSLFFMAAQSLLMYLKDGLESGPRSLNAILLHPVQALAKPLIQNVGGGSSSLLSFKAKVTE